MTDAVVGTGAIVGYGLNGFNRDEGLYELMSSVDRSNQSHGLLTAFYQESAASRAAVQANAVAIEKVAAAINLNIEKTAAASALKLSECCCEIKELIRAEGEKTRDLANAIERDRQSVLLADAKTELLIANLKGNGNG